MKRVSLGTLLLTVFAIGCFVCGTALCGSRYHESEYGNS